MEKLLRLVLTQSYHHGRFLRIFVLALAVVLSVTAASIVQAQDFQGAVTGIVTDSTGAALPQAQVTATALQTKTAHATVTNGNGSYTIPLLPIGTYEVTVMMQGFRTETRGFTLHGGDRLQVDFKLQVGAEAQSITVTDDVPLLETTTGESGETIAASQVHELPLLGRNPFTLALNASGVTIPPGQAPSTALRPFDNGGMDSFQINGGRPNTNEYLINGVTNSAVDTGAAANLAFVPSPDMVQEFKVQTIVYDAEYGRTGGGVISVNLKGGTNQFHGVAYDYVRNDLFNANDFADNRVGNPKGKFRWSQPGLEVAGPIFVPKLYDGRNKTFFMFGWEDIRTNVPAPTVETVPTDLERQGDFSQSLNGKAVAIYDPLTTVQNSDGSYSRAAFSGSQIPSDRLDPVAQKVLAFIPHANMPANGNVNNLLASPNSVTDAYDSFAYRLDQVLSSTQHLSAIYLVNNRHQVQGLAGFPIAVAPSYLHYRTNHVASLDWNWTLSPTLVSSFRVGWNEHNFAITNQQPEFDVSTLGFPASTLDGLPAGKLFPSFSLEGYTRFGNAGFNEGIFNNNDNYDLRETLIKSFGKHDLSFGAEIRPMRDTRNWAAAGTSFSFGKDFTQANPLAGDAASGNAAASFLLGYADDGSASSSPKPAYSNGYYALFVQDNWRITPRLALTLGLRWDTETPEIERHNKQNVGFDPNAGYTFGDQQLKGVVQFAKGGSRAAYDRDLNNFGPRFGFAYQVNDKVTVRGGAGILYSPTFNLPSANGYSASTPYVASNDNMLTPATTLSNPFPTGFVAPSGSSANLNGTGGWSYWENHKVQIPRTTQFSFGVQYQLPWKMLFETRYVGQTTRNLQETRNPNFLPAYDLALGNQLNTQVANPFAGLLPGTSLNAPTITLQQSLLPFMQYTGFTVVKSNGSSIYHGLQARVEKRLSNGLFLLGSYSFAKSMVNEYLNDQDIGLTNSIDQNDVPQNLTISGGYAFPFFMNASNALAKQALGGWEMNVIYSASSGALYAAPTSVQSTGVNPHIAHPTRDKQFNTCTITVSQTRQNCTGSESPAWYITPPFALNHLDPYFGGFRNAIPQSVNMSIFKTFPIHESLALQFRAESFNLTNSPQFGAPDTSVNSPTFGKLTNYGQLNDPRNVQFALKLSF